MPAQFLLFTKSIIAISKVCPWYLWIGISHDIMSWNCIHINVKVPCFHSTCFVGIVTLHSYPLIKGSISVISVKYRNCITTAAGTPPFLYPSELVYTKYITVPLAQLCNPTSVHKFDVNMTSALTEKYNTAFKLFASLKSFLAALVQIIKYIQKVIDLYP